MSEKKGDPSVRRHLRELAERNVAHLSYQWLGQEPPPMQPGESRVTVSWTPTDGAQALKTTLEGRVPEKVPGPPAVTLRFEGGHVEARLRHDYDYRAEIEAALVDALNHGVMDPERHPDGPPDE